VCPSPKSHAHEVAEGAILEKSTFNGAQPFTFEAEKSILEIPE
jgi:hypothetical protein